MTHRYCEKCEKWYESYQYEVREYDGEVICPKDGTVLHGFINPVNLDYPQTSEYRMSVGEFRRQHSYLYKNRNDHYNTMLESAKEQRLVGP